MSIPDIREARALLDRGNAREAVQVLEALVVLFPRYAAAHVLLAKAYEARQAWHQALVAWQDAALLVPGSRMIRSELQRAALTAAQPSPAPPASDEALDFDEAMETAEADAEVVDAEADLEPIETEEPPVELETTEEGDAEADESSPTPPGPTVENLAERLGGVRPTADQPESPPSREDPDSQAEPGSFTRPRSAVADFEDLDRLIEELESARIVPRPDFDAIPSPDLEDEIEDVVSETLARIYAAQEQFDEAARVYEALARQQPDRASEFTEQAARMRARHED